MTATNSTLNEILSTETGPASIKSLAWVMLGGLEDGAKIIVEPLLDDDITVDTEKKCALVAINFGVVAPKELYQWTSKDRRAFDNLEQALANAEKAMEAYGAEVVLRAATIGPALNKPKVKKKLNQGKRPRSYHRDGPRVRSYHRDGPRVKDDPFMTFVKAARFVRGMGAGTIHPSAKLRLFGLLMQAQRGSIPAGDQAQSVDVFQLQGSALALQKLKLKAWRSQKDKSREDAMKEYVELVTSLAPQWKVAHIVGGHVSKEKKPRQMMWVMKVNYSEKAKKFTSGSLKTASNTIKGRHCVTSIEVLQSSNATSARLWVEDKSASKEGKAGRKEEPATTNGLSSELGGGGISGDQENREEDPFIANIPKEEEWSLSDCIVDRSKFKTIEDQRAHFRERMRKMALADRDVEDGWKFYCKTKSPALAESEQYVLREDRGEAKANCPHHHMKHCGNSRYSHTLFPRIVQNRLDIWQRDVPWSPVKQMRSVVQTTFSLDDVFDHLCNFKKLQFKHRVHRHVSSEKVKKATGVVVYPFTHLKQDNKNTATKVQYRIMP